MTAAIEIYTRPGCGYCGAAKSLLMRKKAAFIEFDVAKDPALRQEMWDRAGVGSTFPQIFIGEIHVGGCGGLLPPDSQGANGLLPGAAISAIFFSTRDPSPTCAPMWPPAVRRAAATTKLY